MSLLASRAAGLLLKNPLRRWTPSSTLAPSIKTMSRPCRLQAVRCASLTSGGPSYGALLLDVGGTLLEPSTPVAEIYASVGKKYGVKKSLHDVKMGFRKAFSEPWPGRLRYEGDGKPFWRQAVATATGCQDETYFEELYSHFAKGEAWEVVEGAYDGLVQLRSEGVKLAIVSNFDSRLRGILQELEVLDLFDAVIVSCEIGYEKPAPEIFEAALGQLKVRANQAVHVGDDALADEAGAKALGMEAWLWKRDVNSFQEIVDRIVKPPSM